MSTQTTNLKLVKPELTDVADITAFNSNWDKLDEKFNSNGKIKSDSLDIETLVSDLEEAGIKGGVEGYSKEEVNNLLEEKSNSDHKHSMDDITSGTLPIEKGGTGATTIEGARTNLGVAPMYTYSTTDIVAGTTPLETGKLYFVYA
jgi:hypothetical protein